MPWNFLEEEKPIIDRDFDYRFSINDFRSDQVKRLIGTAYQASGNDTLKLMLREELDAQVEERDKFYSLIRKRRFQNANRIINKKILEKLFVPESVQNFLLRREKTEKIGFHFKRWEPPDDINAMVSVKYPVEESLAALQPDSVNLSGLERLKRAFFPSYFVPNYIKHEPCHTFNRDILLKFSLGVGFTVGMIMGYSYGRQYMHEHDQTRSGNMYANKSDVLRTRYDSFLKGYTRYGFRWAWRYTFLIGSMYLISQGLCIYRLKESPSNYITAAVIPTALYKWTRGPKGMLLYGALGGLFVGVPFALITSTTATNVRAAWYDASVLPQVKSKYHWYNWTDEQHELSEKRLNDLLEEIKLPEYHAKRDKSVYQVLIPDDDIS